MMKFPTKITILGDTINVIEKKFTGKNKSKKGYFDTTKGIIAINKDIPKIGKFITLIHEAMHVVEVILLQNKVIKKHIDHDFIGGCSFGLAVILIACGAVKGITEKHLIKFWEDERND